MRKASQVHTPAAHHGPGAGRRPDSRGTGLNHGLPLCGQTWIRISTLSIDPDTPEHMDDFDAANGTLELIRKRQQTSPRRLVAPGPTPEQVQALFEAAAQAPDHGLIRPWRFVRVSDAARGQLGEAFAAALLERDAQATPQQLQDARDKAQRAPFLAMAIVETQGKIQTFPWPSASFRWAARSRTCCSWRMPKASVPVWSAARPCSPSRCARCLDLRRMSRLCVSSPLEPSKPPRRAGIVRPRTSSSAPFDTPGR